MLLNDIPEEYRPSVASISIDGTSATTLIIDRWTAYIPSFVITFYIEKKTRCKTKYIVALISQFLKKLHIFLPTKMENYCNDKQQFRSILVMFMLLFSFIFFSSLFLFCSCVFLTGKTGMFYQGPFCTTKAFQMHYLLLLRLHPKTTRFAPVHQLFASLSHGGN